MITIFFETVLHVLVDNIYIIASLLPILLVLKQVKDDVRPIFVGMVGPLAKQAQVNAAQWAIGIMLGIQASLGAMVEVAIQQQWVYVGIVCKVLGPGLSTIIALILRSPVNETKPVAPSTGSTTPPFSASINQ